MKNKHFHYYWALWEKFCLDQGSCTSAASVRWGLVGNTLLTLQRAIIGILEVNWPEANKLCLLILHASRWTSPSPQIFILPSCVFYGASDFWRRRDTCLCLAWWDPDLHCSMCTLWRHKTKARRFVVTVQKNQNPHTSVISQKQNWCPISEVTRGSSWGMDGYHMWKGMASSAGMRTQAVQLSPLPGGGCSSSCTVKIRAAWPTQTASPRTTSDSSWAIWNVALFSTQQEQSPWAVCACVCPCQGLCRTGHTDLPGGSKANTSTGYLYF